MLAYRLRHRIHFQRQDEVQDPKTGAVRIVWATAALPGGALLDSVPAEVLTGAGREFIESAAKQAETSARINLRWFPVDRLELATWRILWDGRVFDITSAEMDATARREWRLKCIDGLTDGR